MKYLIASLMWMCAFWASAADTQSIQINPKSSSQFNVMLPANPTTGYQWSVTSYDKSILQLTGSRYLAPETKLMGAGGQMVFTFSLIKAKSYPSSTKVSFTYARPWEHKSGTVKQLIISFVKPA